MQNFNEKIDKFKNWIKESKHIVFFSGAGVSTASGIPDFRSADGLYSKKFKNMNPESILSRSFWRKNKKDFYEYYFSNIAFDNIKPNIIHETVASWCNKNKCHVITQNIDNLDIKAGNKYVIELHGNINRNYCLLCGKFYDLAQLIHQKDKDGIPTCKCGGVINPDVVLYEDPLMEDSTNDAAEAISNSDLLIIAGTSLSVYPAASYIHFYQGKRIVILNKDTSRYENSNNENILLFNENMKDVFENLANS
ncbi:NAD-dependent deacetylase (plasmid) [Mesomycoplasma conjunctivae]|nr:NAD-dependent deacetylase [Mycoplasmopsis fermentans]VEU66988.1 NAD-dependent deacetylase [Mesomycoplasma conjunctivae]